MKRFRFTSVYYSYKNIGSSMESLRSLGEKGWSIKTTTPIDDNNALMILEKEIID